MNSKQIIGLILTLAGGGALAFGVISLFSAGEMTNGTNWAMTILGGVFFTAGIGLMKTVKSTE